MLALQSACGLLATQHGVPKSFQLLHIMISRLFWRSYTFTLKIGTFQNPQSSPRIDALACRQTSAVDAVFVYMS